MADPFLSELKYLGNRNLDFIEITVDAGTDVSDLVVTVYNNGGSVRSSNNVGDLTPTTIGNKDVYVIDTSSPVPFNGLGRFNGVSLSDDTTVYSFVTFDDRTTPLTATAGPADGLTATPIGIAGNGESLESNDGGLTYFTQTDPNPGTIPCLTAGTRVQTPQGAVLVEELQPGMTVTILSGGTAVLAASYSRTLDAAEMAEAPALYPVRITAGALGDGVPSRDLLVSRQHRMLVASQIVERMFGVPEVLVAAVRLTELPGIYVDTSVQSVTYLHLLFEDHEVIFAEDAPTESLYLGEEALKSLPQAFQDEIATLFPDLLPIEDEPASRVPIPRRRMQRQLVARHQRNGKPVLEAGQVAK